MMRPGGGLSGSSLQVNNRYIQGQAHQRFWLEVSPGLLIKIKQTRNMLGNDMVADILNSLISTKKKVAMFTQLRKKPNQHMIIN